MQPEEGKVPPASAACRRKAQHKSVAEALQRSPLKRAPTPRPPHPQLHLPILTDSEPGHWLQPPGPIINIITMSNSSSAVCKREPTPPASTSPPRRSLRRAVVQQHRRGPSHLPAPKGTSFPVGQAPATCANQRKSAPCILAAGVSAGHRLSPQALDSFDSPEI